MRLAYLPWVRPPMAHHAVGWDAPDCVGGIIIVGDVFKLAVSPERTAGRIHDARPWGGGAPLPLLLLGDAVSFLQRRRYVDTGRGAHAAGAAEAAVRCCARRLQWLSLDGLKDYRLQSVGVIYKKKEDMGQNQLILLVGATDLAYLGGVLSAAIIATFRPLPPCAWVWVGVEAG